MRTRFNTVSLAALVTTLIVSGIGLAGLAVPLWSGAGSGPIGADCQLMAQALREDGRRTPVISANRRCEWRQLGFPDAIVFEDLPAGTETPSRTVGTPEYGAFGFRAEVDVGIAWATLAGEGENCTYYRFWGRWHSAGCRRSWIS